jgi:hypothetical protein
MNKPKQKSKPYWQMNAAELAQATKEFDKEFVADTFSPLSAIGRAAHSRAAKRGVGRPKNGKGSEKIHVTIERTLLKEADAAARREEISRSELIARALKEILNGRINASQ